MKSRSSTTVKSDFESKCVGPHQNRTDQIRMFFGAGGHGKGMNKKRTSQVVTG